MILAIFLYLNLNYLNYDRRHSYKARYIILKDFYNLVFIFILIYIIIYSIVYY